MLLSNIIGFEGIGLGPFTINRAALSNLFNLNIDIYWYAVIITTGMILAMLFAMWQSKHVGLTSDNIIDVCFWAIPAALIGARLYYVIFKISEFKTLFDVINFRNGGLAIYGGIIAGFIVAFIFCRAKKINPLALFDIASLSFLIGQFIGRWGNFFNAEAYGSITDLPWGMTINGRGPFHPTFFYESMWNILGFILLFIFFKKFKKHNGEVFFLYLTWYGIGRAFIEGLRTDSLWMFNLRISQVVAVILAISGVILFILVKIGVLAKWEENYKKKKAEKEVPYEEIYLPLIESIPETYVADEETIKHSLEGYALNSETSESPDGLMSPEEAKAYFEEQAAKMNSQQRSFSEDEKQENDLKDSLDSENEKELNSENEDKER